MPTHPSFVQPSNLDINIWRYMDLAKFMSLIERKSLYFARADTLGDPFEGSMPVANILLRDGAVNNEHIRNHFFPEFPIEAVKFIRDKMPEIRRNAVKNMFISCWHASEYESDAMWSLYGKNNESIAVRTIYRKFCEKMPNGVNIGMVKYIDYRTTILNESNGYNPFLCKRHSFEHEKEARAIIWKEDGAIKDAINRNDKNFSWGDAGVSVNLDVNDVIDEIYVSPTAKPWFFDLIKYIAKTYNLTMPITQSALNNDPTY